MMLRCFFGSYFVGRCCSNSSVMKGIVLNVAILGSTVVDSSVVNVTVM